MSFQKGPGDDDVSDEFINLVGKHASDNDVATLWSVFKRDDKYSAPEKFDAKRARHEIEWGDYKRQVFEWMAMGELWKVRVKDDDDT